MSRQRPVIPSGHTPLKRRERIALAAEVLCAYCMARWSVQRHDLRQVIARLRNEQDGTPAGIDTSADRHLLGLRLGYAVSWILRVLPTDSRCLTRSLVLTKLLARRGLPSSLVIGVSAEPEFAAHAWVEHAGQPLLPAYEARYTRLVEL
jgi:hypothetical protein